MGHACEISNLKILILNIPDRRNIESKINIPNRLAHPMYAR